MAMKTWVSLSILLTVVSSATQAADTLDRRAVKDRYLAASRALRPTAFQFDAYYQDDLAGSPRYSYWGHYLPDPAAVRITKVNFDSHELRLTLQPADGKLPAGELIVSWAPQRAPSTEGLFSLIETAFVVEKGSDTFVPYIANAKGGVVHFVGANHLPDAKERVPTSNIGSGKRCPVCFPGRRRLGPGEPQEYHLARVAYHQILASRKISTEKQLGERVAAAGHRVLKAWPYPLVGYEYEFNVLDDIELNAFAIPTGIVFITKAFLASLESEDELEAVLAHEIAHVESHHTMRQMRADQARETTARIASVALAVGAGVIAGSNSKDTATGINAAAVAAATASDWFAIALRMADAGYQRGLELESDFHAMEYLNKAGPSRSRALRNALSKTIYGAPISRATHWLASHPIVEERIRFMEDAQFLAANNDPVRYESQGKDGDADAVFTLLPKASRGSGSERELLITGVLRVHPKYVERPFEERISAVNVLDLNPNSGAAWNQCRVNQGPIEVGVPGAASFIFVCKGLPTELPEWPESLALKSGASGTLKLKRASRAP